MNTEISTKNAVKEQNNLWQQESWWLEIHVVQWQKFGKIATYGILEADHMPVELIALWEEIRK